MKLIDVWDGNLDNGSIGLLRSDLTSLEGSPSEITGNFNVAFNNLTSFEGGPKAVSGDLLIPRNELSSWEKSPEKVGGSLNATRNKFSNFDGFPEIFGGVCIAQNEFKSLQGCPKAYQLCRTIRTLKHFVFI